MNAKLYRVVWFDPILKRQIKGVAELERAYAQGVAEQMNNLLGGNFCSIEPVEN